MFKNDNVKKMFFAVVLNYLKTIFSKTFIIFEITSVYC